MSGRGETGHHDPEPAHGAAWRTARTRWPSSSRASQSGGLPAGRIVRIILSMLLGRTRR
jgi:hypothetical protein